MNTKTKSVHLYITFDNFSFTFYLRMIPRGLSGWRNLRGVSCVEGGCHAVSTMLLLTLITSRAVRPEFFY